MKFSAVLFDFDGTLYDSAPDIAWCANEVRRTQGLAPIDDARIRTYIGNGSERLLHRCLTDSLEGEVAAEVYAVARVAFAELYLENLTTRSDWYPHAPELVATLNAVGLPTALVTNKPERFTHQLLAQIDAARYFCAVVCGDTLPTRKPDPDMLLHAAEQAGVAPEACVMVGDSQIDLAAARAAGMHAVFVTHGYCRDTAAAAAEADTVCDSLAEVRAAIGL